MYVFEMSVLLCMCLRYLYFYLAYHLTLKYSLDKLIKCLQKLIYRTFSSDFADPEERTLEDSRAALCELSMIT